MSTNLRRYLLCVLLPLEKSITTRKILGFYFSVINSSSLKVPKEAWDSVFSLETRHVTLMMTVMPEFRDVSGPQVYRLRIFPSSWQCYTLSSGSSFVRRTDTDNEQTPISITNRLSATPSHPGPADVQPFLCLCQYLYFCTSKVSRRDTLRWAYVLIREYLSRNFLCSLCSVTIFKHRHTTAWSACWTSFTVCLGS